MTELVFLVAILGAALALAMHRSPLWLWAIVGAAALIVYQSGMLHGAYATPAPGLLGMLAWLAVLAMMFCITPGTSWAELSSDHSMLMLHVLELGDRPAFVAHIKARYERPLMEIFE